MCRQMLPDNAARHAKLNTPGDRDHVSLIRLLRARSRMNATQGDPGRMVLTFSKSGYRTRANQIVLDFETAQNPVSTTLESLGGM